MGRERLERLMKVLRFFLMALGSVALIRLMVIGISYFEENGVPNVVYYSPNDLLSMQLPSWDVTNPPPVLPHTAALSATKYFEKNHPNATEWQLDSLKLCREIKNNWSYHVIIKYKDSGIKRSKLIIVLMNGEVWKPNSK